jgi:adenylate cyclase
MPAQIAERLKLGEQRIADRIEMLCVMFADLIGFTAASHELAPEEVVEFLDGLVRRFDSLCERYAVEKIKTIGDCYMAAAGFDGQANRGAVAMGRLALEMMQEIKRQPKLGGQTLGLRIGIHSGPATVGSLATPASLLMSGATQSTPSPGWNPPASQSAFRRARLSASSPATYWRSRNAG